MSEEIKPEAKIEPSNGKDIPASNYDKNKQEVKPEPEKPITDFKIAEIWIRSGQIMLDAAPNFWQDRCRALGVLELCKDIVKTAKVPEPPKSKIIPVKNGFLNGIRNLKLGRK